MIESSEATSTSRTTLVVVGWNLDEAAKDHAKYKLRIENEDPAQSRDIDFRYLTYQGQYALTVDLSNSGIEIRDNDTKLHFIGFDPEFTIPFTNTAPRPDAVFTRVTGEIRTTNQDREGGFCVIRLMDGSSELWSYRFPEKPTWGDNHSQPFAFDLPNIRVPSMPPQFRVLLTQDGAREKNILWRFNASANFSGTGPTYTFNQSGLSLRCGDGGPGTVETNVNRQ